MNNIIYSAEQQAAAELCADLSKKVVCVTGQAGSGKTTTMRKGYDDLFEVLLEQHGTFWQGENEVPNFSIGIAAPTGRAAKRVEEATGLKAMTVHRLLRYSMPEDDTDYGMPAYSRMNPMPYEAVFVDESSMLTIELRRGLIDALKRGAVIRFFGDVNQLPPIGKMGNSTNINPNFSPFAKDLQRFPSVTLTKNFRSTDGIIELSDRIIRNRMPMANSQVRIQRLSSTDATPSIISIAKEIDFTSDKNQIITPTNKTTYGTDAINRIIQQTFNLEKEKITVFKKDKDGTLITRSYKRGDKIIWTENNYDLDLMNGSIGRVLDFNKETGTIHLTIDNRDIALPSQIVLINKITGEKFTLDPRTQMQLGYAITTHKAQGSQFDTVLFISSRTRALNRQNIYTAVTRAKERLIIFNVAGSLSTGLEHQVNILNETFG